MDKALGKRLVLDELFDLLLYTELRGHATGKLRDMLDQLIVVETRHVAFWKKFFSLSINRLGPLLRLRLLVLVALCRLFGAPAIHLVLEAIEVYGVRKYLAVWTTYRDGPLGSAVQEVLEDEIKHEDAVVSGDEPHRINADTVRNIFLGLNDGLVEILGAVSGLFAAFGSATTVLVAGATVAVAGSLSMAAGAYVAGSSAAEIHTAERERATFLGTETQRETASQRPGRAAMVVGGSYFTGALVPISPVIFGAQSVWPSLAMGGLLITLVSMVLAFVSGMNVRRRIVMNLVIISTAVVITYALGAAAKALWGISL